MTVNAVVPWCLVVLIAALCVAQWRRARLVRERILDSAHELARPLSAIRLGLEMLAREGVGDPGKLDGEAERARGALDELRRIAAPGHGAASDRFDLRLLASEVAGAWSPVAAAQGRGLDVAAVTPAPVIGDRIKIGQALTNLVANSLEHGLGTVRLVVTSCGGSGRVEVVDEGEGLVSLVPCSGGDRLRGRGLRIARAGVAEAGGRLLAGRGAVIELPLADAS